MWRNLFRTLILLVYMDFIISLIVFPFKIPESKDQSFEIRNNLHSTAYLGGSKQLTDFFYYSDDYLYFLDDESCKGDNFFIKNFSEYDKSKYSFYYEDEKIYEINETIYLYKDLKLSTIEKIEEFPFLIKERTLINSQKGCVLLGILYKIGNEKRKINFIEQLKKRELVNNYIWTFKYTSENEGLFIIGGEPHTYDPDNYNESNYLKTNQEFNSTYGWIFPLNKLYIGENQFPTPISGRISFGFNYILSDDKYNQSIYNQYFKEYIENKTCFYKPVSFGHCYYYCDKEKFKLEDMSKFPALRMINLDLEAEFNFTGEELFYEGKDYYYFKIVFMEYSQGGWILGQIFLKKYQLIFDSDLRTIGYYNYHRIPHNEDDQGKKENPPDSKYKTYLYILIPITIIVIAAIIFALIKLGVCSSKRKKKVNELMDEDNEDYFNISGDKKQNKEDNAEDRKLFKSSE